MYLLSEYGYILS